MFNIIGPSSFLRMSFTRLLYLNTEFTLSSTFIQITSKAPSQSHALSHFFGVSHRSLLSPLLDFFGIPPREDLIKFTALSGIICW